MDPLWDSLGLLSLVHGEFIPTASAAAIDGFRRRRLVAAAEGQQDLKAEFGIGTGQKPLEHEVGQGARHARLERGLRAYPIDRQVWRGEVAVSGCCLRAVCA